MNDPTLFALEIVRSMPRTYWYYVHLLKIKGDVSYLKPAACRRVFAIMTRFAPRALCVHEATHTHRIYPFLSLSMLLLGMLLLSLPFPTAMPLLAVANPLPSVSRH